MKNAFKLFIVMMLALTMALSFSACAKTTEATSEDPAENEQATDEMFDDVEEIDDSAYTDNGIAFMEEEEGAEITFKEATAEDFFGSWSSTSGNAAYLYGNCDLVISDNGTWTGNVAEEDVGGEWEMNGSSMVLSSDIFTAILSFAEDGKLIMQEDRAGDGDMINTVLTKNE
jgi:hypothetical protein